MNGRHTLIILCVVICIGAGLRLYRITESGMFLWDEGIYLSEGQFVADVCRLIGFKTAKLLGMVPNTTAAAPGAITDVTQIRGFIPVFGNPVHAALVGLSLLMFNDADWAGRLVSAVLGTGTVIMLFFVGRILYDRTVGLLAAAFLSVSGYHLIYSRESLTEADAIFFFIVVLYGYIRSRRPDARHLHWLGFSGLFCGIAFACKFRVLIPPVFLLFILYEIHAALKERTSVGQYWMRRLMVFSLASLLPLLVIELIYQWPLRWIARVHHVFVYQPYHEQIFVYIHGGLSAISRFMFSPGARSVQGTAAAVTSPSGSLDQFLTFPYLVWLWDGTVAEAGLIGGTGWLVYRFFRQRRFEDLFLGAQIVLPWLFWSSFIVPAVHARFFSGMLPALALVTALVVSRLILRLKKGTWPVYASCIAVICLLGVYRAQGILSASSGYRQAMAFLTERNAQRIYSTQLFIPLFYQGITPNTFVLPTASIPGSPGELRAGFEQGFRYLLVDYEAFLVFKQGRFLGDRDAKRLLGQIEQQCRPIFTVPNPFGRMPQLSFEHNYRSFRQAYHFSQAQDSRFARIAIYDLQDYLK